MIEEEIYNLLVERFGVSEVFLPKRGKKRPRTITWLEFIKVVLQVEPMALPKFCGYSNSNFGTGVKTLHSAIVKEKGKRQWAHYFLALVGYKRCSECKIILPVKTFNRNTHNTDGLRPSCKNCDATYRKSNRASKNALQVVYYKANKERYRVLNKKWRESNKDRIKEYCEKNRHIFAAYAAKRRAIKLQATPNWANLITIKQIYETCPDGYHVDHIVPLQNPLVCGLHCEFNLQHLPALENLTKSNKFEI
jgi:hypothetical protein